MSATRFVPISLLCALLLAAPALAGPGWETSKTHRPRLAFDGRDAAATQRVVNRIAQQQQPWANAYRSLRNLAENGATKDHRSSGWKQRSDAYAGLYADETRNGSVASAKALVAWLYSKGLDPAWLPLPRLAGQATPEGWVRQQAAEARSIIEGMYDDWPCWRGFKVLNRGIVAADSLTTHCVAFDFLAALPGAWRGNLSTAEKRLGDLASDLSFYWKAIDGYDSNHSMRVASGLGIAAVTLNRHDRYRWTKPGTWWHRPKGWIRKSLKNVHPTRRGSDLCYQGRQGAFAEGSSYYHYALDLVMPFAFAYERFTGASGVPLLSSDTYSDLARWGVNLRLPDGRRSQVDNARLFKDTIPAYFLSRIPGGARSQSEREILLWDFRRSGHPGLGGRRAPFLLAAYDPDAQTIATTDAWQGLPYDSSQLIPGGATLRSGWGPQEGMVMVQAQSGELRKRGGGHESVDNGSYVFSTRGDLITLDPGYFGFTGVTKTNRGEHRSLVLVNGKAAKHAHQPLGFLPWRSRGVDTKIQRGDRTRFGSEVRSVAVESKYRKATIERTVALVDASYLLVEDRCRARRTKTYTTQVQANAGAAEQRPLSRSGAVVRYETRKERIQVCVGASASSALSTRTSVRESSIGEGPNGHEAIEYSARGKRVRFLTAIATAAPGAAAPEVAALSLSGGAVGLRVAVEGHVDLVISNPGGAVQVPATAGSAAFSSSHELVVVRFQNGARRVVWSVGSGQVN
jgi:hypothetical protein